MKIAFLILCHKNEIQIKMLVKQLNNEYTDIYVHIDSKFGKIERLSQENIILLDNCERVDVKWSSFSMVTATLNLINKCLSSGKKYDYVFLVSGQDFPLKSNMQILEYLKSNNGCNYIEIKNHNENYQSVFPKRNELYYPQWMINTSFFAKVIRKMYILLTGGRSYTYRLFKRKNTTGLDFEYGSQWWCLQGQVLEWMMNYINNHPEYPTFFKNALTPDECFFQTLFINSPFANTRKDKLMWLQWAGNHPRLIVEDDIDSLIKNNSVLFARKFDMSVNSRPIEMLLEKLREL